MMKAFYGILFATALVLNSGAQTAEAPKPAFNKESAERAPLPLPNPYDKLLAIEQGLGEDKVNWTALADSLAVDVDPNNVDGRADTAMALGVKIADGMVAIKAQDIEKLNRSADQLEALGKKLGATDADLQRARAVRDFANRGEWLMVFLELGFLQADITQRLNTPENKDTRILVIASGWLQGGRYASSLILDNYTPDLSNILREPLLADELRKQLDALPDEMQKSPKVAQLRQALEQASPIVSVGLNEPIAKDDVARLKSIGDTAIQAVTSK